MSQATHLYFDHPYEPDPEERGFYWATRFTDTQKVFGFMPDDLFANVETKQSGEPLTREELCSDPGMCANLTKKENIVGKRWASMTIEPFRLNLVNLVPPISAYQCKIYHYP